MLFAGTETVREHRAGWVAVVDLLVHRVPVDRVGSGAGKCETGENLDRRLPCEGFAVDSAINKVLVCVFIECCIDFRRHAIEEGVVSRPFVGSR